MAQVNPICLLLVAFVCAVGYAKAVEIIRDGADPLRVAQGEEFQLACEDAEGDTLAWFQDAGRVQEDERHSIISVEDLDFGTGKRSTFLLISGAVTSDSGLYECRSLDNPEKPTDSLDVEIYGPEDEEYMWESGETRIQCRAGSFIDIQDAFFVDIWLEGNETDSCEIGILQVDEEYYHEIIQRCQGRTHCDQLTAKVGLEIPCGRDEIHTAGFVKLVYQCATGIEQFGVMAESGTFDFFCPLDHVIDITSAVFGDDAGLDTCEHPIADEDAAYYDDVIGRCDGRQFCDTLQVKTTGTMWCPGSLWFADAITYVRLTYQCREILEYEGVWESGPVAISCADSGMVVEIRDAYFEDETGWTTCDLSVEEEDPAYYRDILARCDGQPRCEGLVAKTGHELWCPGSIFHPDSIENLRLSYRCRNPEEYPPVQEPTTMETVV